MSKKFIIFCASEGHPNIRTLSLNFGREIFARLTTLGGCIKDAEIDDCRVILVTCPDLEEAAIFANKNGLEEKYNVMYSWNETFLVDIAKNIKQYFEFENNPRKFEKFPNGIPGEKDGFKKFDE